MFATLDHSPPGSSANNEVIMLTDTVGFIHNLPHHLVAAFRATLEEVVEADLLLHVVDASQPDLEGQMEAVERVLESLGSSTKPCIIVYNKTDLVPDFKPPASKKNSHQWQFQHWMAVDWKDCW